MTNQNPIAYLITFTTYGTWLHGDNRKSVDKKHNDFGGEFVPPNSGLATKEQSLQKKPAFRLNKESRQIVLEAILNVCQFRNWFAYAIHVRSNHIHSVITAPDSPEKIMQQFKTYATRAIKNSNALISNKYWTRHGSTKYIWTQKNLFSAIEYVKNNQGKTMAFGKSEICNT